VYARTVTLTVTLTATLTVALAVLAGCGSPAGATVTADQQSAPTAAADRQSYQITDRVDALVVDARAAAITLEAGDGPVTVDEIYHSGSDRPATAHRVDGTTLHLTETGCRDTSARCDVEFRVRLPAATTADVTTQAGAVQVAGLTGDLTVSTQAGAVQGSALGGDRVRVSTKAGATTLVFTRAPSTVSASTDVGAVDVRVPSGASYAVDVQSGVGRSDVSVQRDPASPHKIEVRTTVGAVSVGNA
jgi:DUF4097 and DUF4098 domain-containing protein YvlB